MPENLIKEYFLRLKGLTDLVNPEKQDINSCLDIQPKIERKVFELGMILDLMSSEMTDDQRVMMRHSFKKEFSSVSSLFAKLKAQVLNNDGGEE